MLVNIWNTTFLYPFGPFAVLIIYHLTGFIILVLPENFEENVVKKGIINTIRNTILEELNQQGHENLTGYIQLERMLTSCMFIVFNCKFWTNCMFMVFNCIKLWTTYMCNRKCWTTCRCMVFNCIKLLITCMCKVINCIKFWITCMSMVFYCIKFWVTCMYNREFWITCMCNRVFWIT